MTTRATIDCAVLRNSATYDTPTWVVMSNIRNTGLPDARDKAEITTRGSAGIKQFITTLREVGLEFEMNANDDADYTAVRAAYAGRTELDVVLLRGPNTAAVKGIRLRMMVEEFGQADEEAGSPATTVKLCVGPETTPVVEYTVPAS